MSEIGENVVVLCHPGAAAPARKTGTLVVLVVAPIVAGIVLMAGDFSFQASGVGHLPLVAGLVIAGAYLLSTLIALPGLLMMKREQLTQELHVGSLGMELRQVQPRASGPETVTCWRVLWSDVDQAKLRYRDAARPYYAGVEIRTRSGLDQRLFPSEWESLQSPAGARAPLAGRVLIPDADALRATPLLKALSAKGLPVEDDVERPQDRLAARLGLGLGIGAIVAALIFNYFVEH